MAYKIKSIRNARFTMMYLSFNTKPSLNRNVTERSGELRRRCTRLRKCMETTSNNINPIKSFFLLITMPKKFQGTNSKAEVARARKAETKAVEKDKKEKETEEKYWDSWESSDKHAAKKKDRKDEKEKKRLEQLDKKRAAKQLLEEEESKLKGKSSTTATKVTRSEIVAIQEKEAEKRIKDAANKAVEQNVTVDDGLLEENINQLVAKEMTTEGAVQARNVEDAISVLSVNENHESHPEKRMKAAFAQFEEERLPVLKAENPNMRLSQIKQLLRKEWMKSPDNPLNKNFVAYNIK